MTGKVAKMIALFALTATAGCSSCGGADNNSDAPDQGTTPAVDMRAEVEPDARVDDLGDMPTAPEPDMEVAPDMKPAPLTGARVRYDPQSDEFFDMPFPEDGRIGDDGKIYMSDWRRARSNNIIRLWFDAAEELLDGWSAIAGVFVTFDAPIDASTLPASIAATTDTSEGWPSVFLIDVDPDSPERGELFPIECRVNTIDGRLRVPNQLGCKSPWGIVRRPKTQYAFVVTTDVLAADGEAVSPNENMGKLLAGEDVQGKRGVVEGADYKRAADFLGEQGVSADRIASMSLFTTNDPTARLQKIAEFYKNLPTPTYDTNKGLRFVKDYGSYVVVAGFYDVPIVQNGEFPYANPPAGKLALDAAGNIEKVGDQSIRFYLTLPKTAMPAEGYPMLMFMHGSGGVAEQLTERGPYGSNGSRPPAGSGPASVIAPYGIAGFAADFQFHGMRFDPPDTSGLKLYNLINNPRATVDNFLVAANETALHARLLQNIEIDPADIENLPEGVLDVSAAADGLVRFDDDRFVSMGQSMGSTIGLPGLTIDPITDASIMSGSGGVLIEIAVSGTNPVPLGPTLETLLRYEDDEKIDRFDPLLHALQLVWDYVDPTVHARYVSSEPHEGIPGKHILQHSGLTDGYFSPDARAGFQIAIGADLAEPVLEPLALEYGALIGKPDAVAVPVQANFPGGLTVVTRQYQPSVLDGHHVAYQRDDTKAQYACFIKTLGPDSPPALLPVDQAGVEQCEAPE